MRGRIVVTGASGFIGSRILSECLQQGLSAVGVSRTLPRDSNLARHTMQVLNYDQMAVTDATRLIHCAGERRIGVAADATAERDLLRRLCRQPFEQVIFLSSAAVYDDQSSEPCKETGPTVASSPYVRGKLAAEDVVRESNGIVLRLSNVYDNAQMARDTVLGDILAQLSVNEPLQLRDLSPVRDFVHLRDVVRAVLTFVALDLRGLFNIGSGQGTSIEGLARAVLSIAGQAARAVTGAQSAGRSHLVLNVEKAAHEADWRPQVTLEQGLRNLLAGVPA